MEGGPVTVQQYLSTAQTGASAVGGTHIGSKYSLPTVGRRV